MSTRLPFRGSNVPFTFNPESNASVATGAIGAPAASTTQDRLIVGVDFGTTYSGTISHCEVLYVWYSCAQVWLRSTQRPRMISTSSRLGQAGMVRSFLLQSGELHKLTSFQESLQTKFPPRFATASHRLQMALPPRLRLPQSQQ